MSICETPNWIQSIGSETAEAFYPQLRSRARRIVAAWADEVAAAVSKPVGALDPSDLTHDAAIAVLQGFIEYDDGRSPRRRSVLRRFYRHAFATAGLEVALDGRAARVLDLLLDRRGWNRGVRTRALVDPELDAYCAWLASRGLSEMRNPRYYAQMFMNWWRESCPNAVPEAAIRGWHELALDGVRRGAFKSPTAYNRVHWACRYLRYRYLTGTLAQDPTCAVERIPYRIGRRERVLTPDEVRRLVVAVVDRSPDPLTDLAIVELIFATGGRPGEIVRLRREQIVEAPIGWQLRLQSKREPPRLVPLAPAAETVLRVHLEVRAPRDRVFTVAGRPLGRKAFEIRFQRYAASAGLQGVIPYVLRHTWATRNAESGMHPHALATLLGHVGLSYVDRYVHHDLAVLGKALAKLRDFEEDADARHDANAKMERFGREEAPK